MKTVFVDVDTQLDFLYPGGALYVPGAERIAATVARLNRHAAAHGIPVISTTDAHTENDPEFASWPPHCVAGATGQHKAQGTLLERHVVIPNRECDLAIEGAQQIVIEKQTVDSFQAPNMRRVITLLNADEFVVYGVVTEVCVLWAVRGLLRLGKQVTLITDAVQSLTPAGSQAAIQEMLEGGVTLAPSATFG
jgi:nicotinamidase/pyrazinamidase